MLKIIECPRDAMQGIKEFIPTSLKAEYLNSLLKVGFDTIDFGSFVSPKAIPQLRDTAEVLSQLQLSSTTSKLLAIVANKRGAEDAVKFDEISFLGFTFSVSETFQQRNTNSSIDESLKTVDFIQDLCVKSNKAMVVYLSMAFGNPYNDDWNSEIVIRWAEAMAQKGIKIIALADTIGSSTPENISYLMNAVIPMFPEVEIGAHLHSTPEKSIEKINSAYHAGCRRFDVALKGFGGCPMAADQLTGNVATEKLIQFCADKNISLELNAEKLNYSIEIAGKVFSYH